LVAQQWRIHFSRRQNSLASCPPSVYLGGAQAVESSWLPAFVQRLGELGWVEGRNVRIEEEVVPGNCNQMTGDGETVTPLLPEPDVWTVMA